MNITIPVDMHIHTTASDGFWEPLRILAELKKIGIKTFGITDHDSIVSLDEMNRRARIYEMELINGVELSAEYEGRDLHFLGYFINHHNKRFLDYLYLFRRRRYQRAQEMIDKLAKLNIKISIDKVVALSRNGPVSRPHIADAMVEKGYVSSRNEAFYKYLRDDGPVYVEKYRIASEEVIDLIHSIGGAAFLAHPGLSKASDDTVRYLVGLGLDGLEVIHPRHTNSMVEHYTETAEKLNLLISGGSDFHGDPNRNESLGSSVVDISVVNRIKQYCEDKHKDWIVSEVKKRNHA